MLADSRQSEDEIHEHVHDTACDKSSGARARSDRGYRDAEDDILFDRSFRFSISECCLGEVSEDSIFEFVLMLV